LQALRLARKLRFIAAHPTKRTASRPYTPGQSEWGNQFVTQ